MLLQKYLRWQGYQVYHVQNFTDIDDKIIARALNEGKQPKKYLVITFKIT